MEQNQRMRRQAGLYILMGGLLVGVLWSGAYFPRSKVFLAAILILAGSWELVMAIAYGNARFLRSPALWLFLGFAAFAFASLYWSETPSQTRREVMLMAGYVSVLLVVRSQITRFGSRVSGNLLRWLVYVASFAAAWGIVTYLLRIYPYVTLVDLFLRAGSTFEYSNALACFELMALPVTLAFFQAGKSEERPILGTAAALEIAAVTLTFSRLGLVMLLAVLVYFLAAAWRRAVLPETVLALLAGVLMALVSLTLGEAEFGKTGVAAVMGLAVLSFFGQEYAATAAGNALLKKAFVLVLAAAGAFIAVLITTSHRARVIIGSRFGEGLTLDRLLPHRQLTWTSAYHAFQDRPVRGWGLGAFYQIFSRYQEAQFTRYAHNLVLQMGADTGVIGASLLVLFLGYVVALSAWRLLTGFDLLGRGLAIAALVFLVYNMFDWEWYIPSVTAWFLVIVGCLEERPSSLDEIRGQKSDIDDADYAVHGHERSVDTGEIAG